MSRAQDFADQVDPVGDEPLTDPIAANPNPAPAQPAAEPVLDPNLGNDPNPAADPNAAAAGAESEYTIRQFLQEEGYQGVADAQDDYEALTRVLAGYRQLEQREQAWQLQLAQSQQQLAQLARQAAAQGQGGAPPQTVGAGQAGAGLPAPLPNQPALPANWKAPEWKPEWSQWIDKDPATGQLIVRSGGDPTLLQKYHAYQGHLENVAYQLSTDPVSFLSQFGFLTQQQAAQQAQELVGRELARIQQAQALDQLWRENEMWMAQVDPRTGRAALDPISGQVLLSREGQVAKQHFYTLVNSGLNPHQAMTYAKAYVSDGVKSQLLELQQAPNEAAERQQRANRAFSRGAARRPNRGGARPQEAYQNRPAPNHRDFAAMAWQNAEHLGVAAERN